MLGAFFLTGLLSLSSSPLWVRFAGASIELICFWRLFIASLLILAWMGVKRLLNGPSQERALQKKDLLLLLGSGFFFFLHLWTYVASAQNTSVAHLMILFSTNPLFTSLGSRWLFNDPLKKRIWLCYPLAAAGIYLIAQDKVNHAPAGLYGDVMALISALLHAGYLLLSKKARTHVGNTRFSLGLYLSSAAFFFVLALSTDVPLWIQVPSHTTLGILGLVLFPTFLGHVLMTYLVSHMSLTTLSFGKLLEPGMASFLAYILYQEQLTTNTALAFFLTAGSVMLLLLNIQKLKSHVKFFLRAE